MHIHLLLFLFISNVWAQDLVRLDQFKVETFKDERFISLYITENCSICEQQIQALKGCIDPEKVTTFIQGQEDKLRRVIKRKKIPFATYLVNDSLKEKLGFGSKSPAIRIKTLDGHKILEGLQTCEVIKSLR